MRTRRIICLWLPHLALQRHLQANYKKTKTQPAPNKAQPVSDHTNKQAEHPLALIRVNAKGIRILHVNQAAFKAGVKPAMRLSDARAICHELKIAHHDNHADKVALEQIVQWLDFYSPSRQIYRTDTILIDSTGCDHLFGGERAMLKNVQHRLAHLGFTARLGLADNIGTAFALAHYHEDDIVISAPGKLHQTLAFLPIKALRIEEDQADALCKLGLKTIGQLFDIPRASLARRFTSIKDGHSVLQRLDQALGNKPEPLIAGPQQPHWRFTCLPAEPCLHFDGIMHVFEELLSQLLNQLKKRQSGLLDLHFFCFYSNGGQCHAKAHFSTPCQTEKHIKLLFIDQLRALDPRFGFDGFVLSTNRVAKLAVQQFGLLEQETSKNDKLPQLVERIANRLGSGSIFQLHKIESHLPEKAQHPSTLLASRPKVLPFAQTPVQQGPRPITIFAHPELIDVIAEIPEGPPMRFRWRKVLRTISRASGPERIAPEWWHDLSEQQDIRDYYQLEDTNGQRYWVFRVGLYDQSTSRAPHWRIHGLFL